MPNIIRVISIVSVILLSCSHAYAKIEVIDGDTLKINGLSVRLYGIDAPEKGQLCTSNGKSRDCGAEAKQALKSLITEDSYCIIKGKGYYGRTLAICYTGIKDINAELVRKGLAVAYKRYSKDYLPHHEYARQQRIGMWSGVFEVPENYRKRKRAERKKSKEGK